MAGIELRHGTFYLKDRADRVSKEQVIEALGQLECRVKELESELKVHWDEEQLIREEQATVRAFKKALES